MNLIRPVTLGLATVISAPALWHGFVVGDLSLADTLTRFLFAVPVSAVIITVLTVVTADYRKRATELLEPVKSTTDLEPLEPMDPALGTELVVADPQIAGTDVEPAQP